MGGLGLSSQAESKATSDGMNAQVNCLHGNGAALALYNIWQPRARTRILLAASFLTHAAGAKHQRTVVRGAQKFDREGNVTHRS
eukprot:6200856-Pleurochrysis_carterae.AAC.1